MKTSLTRHEFMEDGTRIAYYLHGPLPSEDENQDLSPLQIALCDGISCDGYIWKFLLPVLSEKHPILHMHYRGHGRSGIPRDLSQVNIPNLAHDLDHLLKRVNFKRTVIVAHSMGVQVALETALRYPEQIAGLILLCGADGRLLDTFQHSDIGFKVLPHLRHLASVSRKAMAGVIRAVMPTRFSYMLARLTEIKGDKIKPKDLQPYLDHFSRMPIDVFTKMLTDASERTSSPALPHLQLPVLVIAGKDDGFTPIELSQKMAAALPHSRFVPVENTSHTAPLEQPDIFEKEILAFLKRIENAKPPKETSILSPLF